MAPHSSTLAWRIPGMEEPGRLQSMGSRRPSQSAHDLLCLQEGGTCLVSRWYLQAGVSRLWDQERLPGGQVGTSGPLHSHSTPPPLPSFHVCIPAMPRDTWEDAPDLPSNLLPRPWTMT